jgi:predicted transglutaminase-like cysteine proteinase
MTFTDWIRKTFCADILLENDNLKADLTTANSQVDSLQTQLKALTAPKNPKEDEYNNKYPKANLTYLKHETDGDYSIDLRNFYMLNDASIPVVTGKNDDEKALNALKYVIKNVTYVDDKKEYGYEEYWAYAFQTLKRKKGDCEDGAILLANIMVKSGIPYWKVRLSAGSVKGGGHCYLTYYCESKDMWVILDWCYWPNQLAIADRKNYKDETNYLDVWFSWNRDYCFSQGTNLSVNGYLNTIKIKPKKRR